MHRVRTLLVAVAGCNMELYKATTRAFWVAGAIVPKYYLTQWNPESCSRTRRGPRNLADNWLRTHARGNHSNRQNPQTKKDIIIARKQIPSGHIQSNGYIIAVLFCGLVDSSRTHTGNIDLYQVCEHIFFWNSLAPSSGFSLVPWPKIPWRLLL